jgi:hypothetical protein
MFFVGDVRPDAPFALPDWREIALYNAGRIVYGVDADGVTRVQAEPGAITMTCGTRGTDGVLSALRHDLATNCVSSAR